MSPKSDAVDEPLLRVIEDLALPHLHAAACATCADGSWRFNHGSNPGDSRSFWTMDLGGDAAFDAIWEQARAKCERMAGARLRVIRQYANGHTYGLGGAPHKDDDRPGTYTLLYYPVPEWKAGWEGETMFYGKDNEIAFAVDMRPNRAVFFDSRILHNGRAPGRDCPALRISVAYKLETIPGDVLSGNAALLSDGSAGVDISELRRDGEKVELRVHVSAAVVTAGVKTALQAMAQSVSLPGYEPGHAPPDLIAERYGAQVRHDVLRRIAAELIELRLHPRGVIVAECEVIPGTVSGGADLRILATDLTALPPFQFDACDIEYPPAKTADRTGFQRSAEDAVLDLDVREQVLDWLNVMIAFPVLQPLVERELSGLVTSAGIENLMQEADDQGALREELRLIAERRLRLGFLVIEIARRLGLAQPAGPRMEDAVIAHILECRRMRNPDAAGADLPDRLK